MGDLATHARYLIGSAASRVERAVLASPAFPLTRLAPRGRHWLYDVQRFIGSRDVGVVFDVGANVGQTAALLTGFCRRSPIYCFEPVSSAFAQLQARFGARVRCVRAALGREPGVQPIKLFADSEINTFASPRTTAPCLGVEDVPVTTIDAFCTEQGVPQVGILKLDVQGWEMEALAGAREMLSRRAIQVVYAEVGFRERDTDMQPFAELNAFLQHSGFEFCGLYENFRWGRSKAYVGFANALYVLPRPAEASA